MDTTAKTVPKRVRAHQILQTSLILVVGDKEASNETVAVRYRDEGVAALAVNAAHALNDSALVEAMTLPAQDGRVAVHEIPLAGMPALCTAMCDSELGAAK